MKKVFFTSKVMAHQKFVIDVSDQQYQELLKWDAVSGEKLAEYIEDNLLENEIDWGVLEDAEGIESAWIYKAYNSEDVEIYDVS